MCQLSFLTQLPFWFFSYLFSTALQATLWARSSSPYCSSAELIGQVILDALWQLRDLLVRHLASSFGSLGRGARVAEKLPVTGT
jgi:hypothetical protein